MSRAVRALRGATTVEADEPAQIRAAARELFPAILAENSVSFDDLISVFVTTTPDIVSMFPATAFREECGLDDVPLMGAVEADVAGGTPLAIRVMVHCISDVARSDVRHIFQGRAAAMRPDLLPDSPTEPAS